MRSLFLLAGAGLVPLAGCVPAPTTAPPAPAARPAPAPAPVAPRPAPALGADWRDWPLTPGDWRYRSEARGGVASYGTAGAAPLASLRCDLAARRVTFARAGGAAATLTVRTTSAVRTVPMVPDAQAPGTIATGFPANDGFLDAMGFSRGRLVVEGGGLPTLVLPAWPEILRVVEDCRK
ncbi:hypothetical protein [Sphingomonas elodea]|uniref:hypothetical protein n=1 Tax=Sphingomonas elodea TaxID=179878 RepID=UPI00026316C4|nr:hypothetical protein [Sphingomonas elodea]